MNDDPSRLRPNGPTPGAAAPQTGDRNPELRGKAHPRILLVDDDADVRHALGSGLQLFNYQVDMAYDGEMAWEALCARSYDLLITDHMMPALTGLELLRRLRTVRVDLPCILISGNLPSIESDLGSLVQPGRAVDKPIKLAELIATVEALLSAHPIRHAMGQSGNGRPALCRT